MLFIDCGDGRLQRPGLNRGELLGLVALDDCVRKGVTLLDTAGLDKPALFDQRVKDRLPPNLTRALITSWRFGVNARNSGLPRSCALSDKSIYSVSLCCISPFLTTAGSRFQITRSCVAQ